MNWNALLPRWLKRFVGSKALVHHLPPPSPLYPKKEPMLKLVENPSDDLTGYLVASMLAGSIKVIANFRYKDDAQRFIRMLRMSGKGPEVGLCECQSKVPIWSPLDRGIQPPQKDGSNVAPAGKE